MDVNDLEFFAYTIAAAPYDGYIRTGVVILDGIFATIGPAAAGYTFTIRDGKDGSIVWDQTTQFPVLANSLRITLKNGCYVKAAGGATQAAWTLTIADVPRMA